jgi:hypothetical protein
VTASPESDEQATSSPPEAGLSLVPQLRKDAHTSVVREFDADTFEAWPSWYRLLRLMTPEAAPDGGEDRSEAGEGRDGDPHGGGSYGIAGPRGAGKSWLMKRAVAYAQHKKGLGLWYPSPSEYNSMAFLASLSESLANEIEESRRREKGSRYSTLGLSGLPYQLLFILVSGAYAGFTLRWVANLPLITSALIGVTAGVLFGTVPLLLRRRVLASSEEGRLRLYASRLKQQVRFTLTRREAIELGAESGKGILAKVGVSRERELVERPLTLSTLIQDFRELARLAGKHASSRGGPVVIAIDELDKMTEHEKVRQLLRDIKGIFGVPNVYFLVSVSDEAARALNLNGLAERNEFNSSFDAVIELPRVSIAACGELLSKRGFLPEIRPPLAVMSGGIPRELVRIAELVDSSAAANGRASAGGGHSDPGRRQERTSGVTFAVCEAMKVEALQLRDDIVTATATSQLAPLREETKRAVFHTLSDQEFSPDRFARFATRAMAHHWAPKWHDSAWDERFSEAWCRLLVRLHVAGRIVSDPQQLHEGETARELQEVVATSSHSAATARAMIDPSFAASPQQQGQALRGLLNRFRVGNG